MFNNSNLWHNILNVLIAVSGVATTVLIVFGCVELPTGIDCSASSLSPKWTAIATTVMGGIKMLINIGRDGFSGLAKVQPPVK